MSRSSSTSVSGQSDTRQRFYTDGYACVTPLTSNRSRSGSYVNAALRLLLHAKLPFEDVKADEKNIRRLFVM
jgi:hypothetical protein